MVLYERPLLLLLLLLAGPVHLPIWHTSHLLAATPAPFPLLYFAPVT